MPKNAFRVLSTEALFVMYYRLQEKAFTYMRKGYIGESKKVMRQARSIWETIVSREVAA
jgi:hypothetical protein